MTPEPCVALDEVTKTFETAIAVDDVSLRIPEHCIYGFIGPNGSGKTTTMRLIMSIFEPDRGTVRVFGDAAPRTRLGSIGYLPEERGIYKKMTVRGLLRFHAELRGIPKVNAEVDSWLERLSLGQCASSPIETMSKGMTQKVQFIAAVIGNPRLIILDEPFSGLDPVSSQGIRAAILDLRRNGSTVVLSTHDMSTAEQMCDRIFMIYKGRKVLDGTLSEIQDTYGTDTLHVSAENAAAHLAGMPGIEQIRELGSTCEVRLSRNSDPQLLLKRLVERSRVLRFSIEKPSLQDIFLRIAGSDAVRERQEVPVA